MFANTTLLLKSLIVLTGSSSGICSTISTYYCKFLKLRHKQTDLSRYNQFIRQLNSKFEENDVYLNSVGVF